MTGTITTIAQLEALYGLPGEASTVKEVDTHHAALPRFHRSRTFRGARDQRAGRARLLAARRQSPASSASMTSKP